MERRNNLFYGFKSSIKKEKGHLSFIKKNDIVHKEKLLKEEKEKDTVSHFQVQSLLT